MLRPCRLEADVLRHTEPEYLHGKDPLAAMGQDSHESRGHMNSGTFFSQSQSCFFPFITSLVNPSLASQHKACCLVRWWVLAGSSLQPNAVQAGKLVILHDYCHTMRFGSTAKD